MKHSSNVVKAKDEVIGVKVVNPAKENLGNIAELMLDKISGRVAYAVLESGSFLGMGGKLFALPWNAISYDPVEECFVMDVNKEKLSNAPEYDDEGWPNIKKTWEESIFNYYDTPPYWI